MANSSTGKRPIQDSENLAYELTQNLGPEYVSYKPGPGGGYAYLDGGRAIQIANEVFGFDGWNSQVMSNTVDFCDGTNGKYEISVTCTVRVTLNDRNRTFHEGIGNGTYQNARCKADAYEKGRKEAFTDALKRALVQFGEVTGNCLRDKNYLKQLRSMNCVPQKFDPEDLRRPIQRTKRLAVDHIYPSTNVTSESAIDKRLPVSTPGPKPITAAQTATRSVSPSDAAPGPHREDSEEESEDDWGQNSSQHQPPEEKPSGVATNNVTAEFTTPARKTTNDIKTTTTTDTTTTTTTRTAPAVTTLTNTEDIEAMFVTAGDAELYQSSNGKIPESAGFDVSYRSPMHTMLPQDRSQRIPRTSLQSTSASPAHLPAIGSVARN